MLIEIENIIVATIPPAITIFGGVCIVYYRESLKEYKLRENTLRILDSNVTFILNRALENKHLMSILSAGKFIEQEKSKQLGIHKRLKKEIEILEELKENFKDPNHISDTYIYDMASEIKAIHPKELKILIAWIDHNLEAIDKGNMILESHKMQYLEADILGNVKHIKENLIECLYELKLVISHLYFREKADEKIVRDCLSTIVGHAVKAASPISKISKRCVTLRENKF